MKKSSVNKAMRSTVLLLAVALSLGTLLSVGSSKADAPPGRYVIITSATLEGGTVEDTRTGLTWQRTVPGGSYKWTEAQTYCATLGTGWRLPSVKELMTLVDVTRMTPAIDVAAFPNTPNTLFWSSSPYPDVPSFAFNVDFNKGYANVDTTVNGRRVRCVR